MSRPTPLVEWSVPRVRDRLYALAESGESPTVEELRFLADQLWRRRSVRKAPPSTTPMTPELAADIRAYRGRNPDVSEFEIGVHFGVNQGRVSEALRGKRGE